MRDRRALLLFQDGFRFLVGCLFVASAADAVPQFFQTKTFIVTEWVNKIGQQESYRKSHLRLVKLSWVSIISCQGRYLKDVCKIFVFLDPLPPFVRIRVQYTVPNPRNLPFFVRMATTTLLPSRCGRPFKYRPVLWHCSLVILHAGKQAI